MGKREISKLSISLCLILVLVIVSLLAACTAPAPAPAPAPSPTKPAPAPSPPPEHEPYEVEIWSLPEGMATYILGEALAAMINENSTWLHATSVEGQGPPVHLKMMIAEPERRAHMISFLDNTVQWAGTNQLGAFEGVEYDFNKFVGLYSLGALGEAMAVADPKIKALEDLRGKRVALDSNVGGLCGLIWLGCLKEAGVGEDELKLEYLKPTPSGEALRDGLIDATRAGFMLQGRDKWGASPSVVEMATMKDTYFISNPAEYINAYRERTGCMVSATVLPPETMGPLQTEPLSVWTKHFMWGCHTDLPDDVVTEILNIVYTHAEEFGEYHPMGKILTKQTIATMGLPPEQLHPAGVKFFEQKGIPITHF